MNFTFDRQSDIAVGRSAKKFRGDRGAESYNYPQAQRDSMTSKNKASNAFRQELDKVRIFFWMIVFILQKFNEISST